MMTTTTTAFRAAGGRAALLLAAALLLLAAGARACDHSGEGALLRENMPCIVVSPEDIMTGAQHADCQYQDLRVENTNDAQYLNDLRWLGILRQHALAENPTMPFGGLLVDSRTNTLVKMRANTRHSNSSMWASIPLSHAELGLLVDVQVNGPLFDLVNATTGRRSTNPDWKHMVLYSTVSVCNMCQAASAWFGIKRLVYGARSTELYRKRCWGQATLSVQELAEHSAPIVGGYEYVRGPFSDLEGIILNDFVNRCPPPPTPAPPTDAPTIAPTAAPTAPPPAVNSSDESAGSGFASAFASN